MDYLFGVLYATKRYEPLDMSKVQADGTPPLHPRAVLLQPEKSVSKSLAGALLVPNATGSGSEKENVGSHGAPPLRRGVGGETPMSPLTILPHTLTSGSGHVSVTISPSQSMESRVSSTSLAIGGMAPCSLAGDAAIKALGVSCEGPVASLFVPGQTPPNVGSGAVHSAPGGGNIAGASRGHPANRCHRLEYSVPTTVISGKYVLLYLPPPHRPGERAAAAMWRSVSTNGAAVPTNAGMAASGSCGNGGGTRVHHASGQLPSPSRDLAKAVRLSGNTSASSNLIAGMAPHTMPTCSGRPSLSTPRGKSVEAATSTSAAAVGGHHTSHSGPGCGTSAAARQAIVRAAAAAESTQQKLLLFYCLLLDSLSQHKSAERNHRGLLREADGDVGTSVVEQVPVAVVELQYTTGEPVRSNAGGMSGISIFGGSPGVGAGADGLGGAVSASQGVTPAGGAGNIASPLAGGSRTHTFGSLPVSSTPQGGSLGARGGPMHSGASFSFGGAHQAGTTTSAAASPRVFADPFLANACEFSVARDDVFPGEGRFMSSAGLRELVRGGLSNSDPAATLQLSTVLRHLLDGQPNLCLNPDTVVFDSEVTQNPYYGGWYSVDSNDGYRRVMHICNIQSWPAVVLVDPNGRIVTVEALEHMEEEFARYIDEVDAVITKASTTRTAASTASGVAAAAPPASGAAKSLPSPAARTSDSASTSLQHTGDVPKETAAILPPSKDEAHMGELHSAQRLPTPWPSCAPLEARLPDASTLLADSTTAVNCSSTNPLGAPVEVAVVDDETSPYDSEHTPGRHSSSLLGSTGIPEDSVSVCDPQASTAEPTPMKTAPMTARYRNESSDRSTTSAQTPAEASASPVSGSPSFRNASRSNSGISSFTQQNTSSPDRDRAKRRHGDAQTSGIAAAACACLDKGEDAPEKPSGTPEEMYEKSISLTAEPLSHNSYSPQQQSATNASAGTAFFSASARTTKGDTAFPSWDAKAYGGDVASVLVLKHLDMDPVTPVRKSQTNCIHASHGTASTAVGEEEEEVRTQASLREASPALTPLHTSCKVTEASAQGIIGAHSVDIASKALSAPQPSSAPLPVFSSRFPWNDVLTDPSMAYTSPSLVAKGVDTVLSVAHGAATKLSLDRDRNAAVFADAQEEAYIIEGNRSDPTSPAALAHLSRCRAATPISRSVRLGSAFCDDGGSNELDRSKKSSSVKTKRSHRSTRSSSALVATAVVSSAMEPRQTGLSNRSTSISVSGSSTSSIVCDTASAPLAQETTLPQSGESQNATTEDLEVTKLADQTLLMCPEYRLPLYPLERLAFCTMTVGEVRERAGHSTCEHTRLSLGFGSEKRHPKVTSGAQQGVREPGADYASNGSAAPSLSVNESVHEASSRRSAALHGVSLCAPLPPLVTWTPTDAEAQRVMTCLLEKWQREMDVKFKRCTHALIVFGAGWHPGMATFIRSVRKLCRNINESTVVLADTPTSGKELARNGCGDVERIHLGLGATGMRGFNCRLDAEADYGATLTSSKDFSGSPGERTLFNAGDFSGGVGAIDTRFDSCSLGSFACADAHDSSAFGDVVCTAGVSPRSGAMRKGHKPISADSLPCRRVQIIYISADESLEACCSAMEDMPAEWLCVSPCVAHSKQEAEVQRHVTDMARKLFRVNCFPRMVVAELPYTHQQDQQQPVSAACKEAVRVGCSSTEGECIFGDERGDATVASMTPFDATATSQNRSDKHYEASWTVVQPHGEHHLYSDPEGKLFPWSMDSVGVLHMKANKVPTASRSEESTHEVLRVTVSSHLSPLSARSYPDSCGAAVFLRSHAELMTASGTPTKAITSSRGCASGYSQAASLYQHSASLFPPIKPFLVADGELPFLLERGGYFVVLGALGSVDAQLHQQCVIALDEVRRWLYTEIEERKRRAWSEPTHLRVMAPHTTYEASLPVRDPLLSASTAYQINTGGGALMEEYGLPIRHSPGLTVATALSVATDSGDVGSAAGLQRAGLGSTGSRRGSTPIIFEDGWPDSRGGTTPPRYAAAGLPMSGSPPFPFEGPTGVHGFSTSSSPSPTSAAVTHKVDAPHRLLPTVYFYDSIFTQSPVPEMVSPTTAPDHCGGVRGRGVHGTEEERLPRVKATPLRQSSPAATGASERVSPLRRSCGCEKVPATAATSSPSPAPLRRVLDNTSALRRLHAKDVSLLQEYILAPILNADGKQLPVREGEVYLACVRWPQRTCAVLRRRLGSEARPTALALANTVGSAASLPLASAPSSAVGGAAGGGGASAAPVSGTAMRNIAVSPSPGASQLSPEPIPRRSSFSLGASPPTPSLPGSLAASGNITVAASATTSSGNYLSSHPSSTASPAGTNPGGGSVGATTAGLNSPSLAAVNTHNSASTSLNNTIWMEDGKEGSPDPDATPLASAESIKSFLYDNILRFMET